MPNKYFNCPDGVTRTIEQCLEKCGKEDGERCLTLPTLHELSWGRTWNGKPSTTQLLNPTRMEYLKITCDYAITPKERAFALLGTQHHRRLEIVAKKLAGLLSEQFYQGLINTGTLDLLEPYEDMWDLTDMKTWGSYAVMKMLNVGSYERLHNSLQLNDYRIKAEATGLKIRKMRWQVTVRDGGTWQANKNKLDKIFLMDADKLDDDYVMCYFADKSKMLLDALDKKELPELCPFEERWDGRRCKGSLCEVHEFCPEGRKINKLPPLEVANDPI
jgi:hypothetical protein